MQRRFGFVLDPRFVGYFIFSKSIFYFLASPRRYVFAIIHSIRFHPIFPSIKWSYSCFEDLPLPLRVRCAFRNKVDTLSAEVFPTFLSTRPPTFFGRTSISARMCRKRFALSLLQAQLYGSHYTWKEEAIYFALSFFLSGQGGQCFWSFSATNSPGQSFKNYVNGLNSTLFKTMQFVRTTTEATENMKATLTRETTRNILSKFVLLPSSNRTLCNRWKFQISHI